MWSEDKLTIVNSADLPTVLLPGNYSAKEIIHTVYCLESQAQGFHIPFQALIDAAEHFYCNDPKLLEKAKAVNFALNEARKNHGQEAADAGNDPAAVN